MTDTYSPISLAITGASGSAYSLRLLDCLIRAERQVYLMVSKAAQVVIPMETELTLPSQPREMELLLSERYGAAPGQLHVFGPEQWTAPVASGSNAPGGDGGLAPVPPAHSPPSPPAQVTI